MRIKLTELKRVIREEVRKSLKEKSVFQYKSPTGRSASSSASGASEISSADKFKKVRDAAAKPFSKSTMNEVNTAYSYVTTGKGLEEPFDSKDSYKQGNVAVREIEAKLDELERSSPGDKEEEAKGRHEFLKIVVDKLK